jgi:hypothetical protein
LGLVQRSGVELREAAASLSQAKREAASGGIEVELKLGRRIEVGQLLHRASESVDAVEFPEIGEEHGLRVNPEAREFAEGSQSRGRAVEGSEEKRSALVVEGDEAVAETE